MLPSIENIFKFKQVLNEIKKKKKLMILLYEMNQTQTSPLSSEQVEDLHLLLPYSNCVFS